MQLKKERTPMKPRNTLMQRLAALALAALTVSGSAVYADEGRPARLFYADDAAERPRGVDAGCG